VTSPRPVPEAPGGLPLALLRLADELNEHALREVAAHGGPALNRSEALVFAFVAPQGSTVVELARAAGMTKQSMHAIVRRLIDLGLLEHRPPSLDARTRPVALTADGRRVASTARRAFRRIERRLEQRVGAGPMARFRADVAAMSAELASDRA
jgi:DNA-binding MarR family transcriptional regulator